MKTDFSYIKCDLCGKSLEYKEAKQYDNTIKWYDRKTDKEIKPWNHMSMPVVFLTEQNEGTSCKPYFDTARFDICPECYKKLLETYPITAKGAMGYNTYEWREK